MTRLTVRQIATAGLVAAAYTVISLVLLPISFGVYQIRVAEALTVLPFLAGAAIPGLFFGCLLANVFGGMGAVDIIVGPLITLAAAIMTRYARRLRGKTLTVVLVAIPIAAMWLGAMYFLSGFEMSHSVMTGMVVSVAGLLLSATAANKCRRNANAPWWRTLLFVVSIVLLCLSVVLVSTTSDIYFIIVGVLLLAAVGLLTIMLVLLRSFNSEIGLLVAPLPPVLLNAFGVSIYLAPLLGFDYWFSVQMIGVGQLIACYLIGLPLLLALRKRNMFDLQ
ncbi:MAG: QueT transporter family protein [bacterium]